MAGNIVFFDSRVADIQTLIDGLAPGTEWYLLDADEDGLVQMARVLAGRSGLDSIQIVAHGAAGALQLGAGLLTSDTLAAHADELATLGQALTAAGDLLLFACGVAAGATGESFVTQLARLTGADIAASSDATGTATLGGDWVLEYASGAIEAGSVLGSGPAGFFGGRGSDSIDGNGGIDTVLATSASTMPAPLASPSTCRPPWPLKAGVTAMRWPTSKTSSEPNSTT